MAAMRAKAEQGRRPGRPRSPETDQVILGALIDLIRDGNSLEAISVEAVAAKAGVGKATIYRRWPSKDALVRAAVTLVKPVPPPSGRQSLRDDLVAMVRLGGTLAEGFDYTLVTALMPQLVRGGELHELFEAAVEPCRERVREVLRRGLASGELRADLDIEVALAALMAPMILHRMMIGSPGFRGEDVAEELVDLVLKGALAT